MTNMKETIGNYLRHIREIRLVAVCMAVSALAASAYLAPVEERCGVRVEIGSFPQKTERPGKNPYAWPLGVTEVVAGAPRTFPVTLENRTGMPIAGELEVWMNDDWDVSGPQGPLKLDVWMNDGLDVAYPKGPIVLESGEKKELLFTGTARPRALNALYPVHARFTPNGVKKEDAPHPVAVFMYKNPHAPRPGRKVSAPKLGPQPKVPDEADWKARCATALASAQAARSLPNGIVLPPYGYYARTRNTTSGVVEKGGVRCAFAKSPKGMFVEARELPVGRTVDFGGVKTDGAFRFTDWMITPLPHSKAFSAEIDLTAFGASSSTRADAASAPRTCAKGSSTTSSSGRYQTTDATSSTAIRRTGASATTLGTRVHAASATSRVPSTRSRTRCTPTRATVERSTSITSWTAKAT